MNAELSAEAAASFYSMLASHSIHCWVMGGWGVDALLGRQTRPHHDLDLLVLVDDLPTFHRMMESAGFTRAYLWEAENQWIVSEGIEWPTAFVVTDRGGQELDVYAVELTSEGRVVPRCTVPWVFPDDALNGVDTIGQARVACLSVAAQIAAHGGYSLPAN